MEPKSNAENSVPSGQIKVVLRARPPVILGSAAHALVSDFEKTKAFEFSEEDASVTLVSSACSGDRDRKRFAFDGVCTTDATQERVYNAYVAPVVDAALKNGLHCAVMAYGQTGSGKTHTIVGPSAAINARRVQQNVAPDGVDDDVDAAGSSQEAPAASGDASATDDTLNEDLGMVPRVIHRAFAEKRGLESAGEGTMLIAVSCIEIYSEKITDLLNDAMHSAAPVKGQRNVGSGGTGLRIRCRRMTKTTGASSGSRAQGDLEFYVENLFKCECDSPDEAMRHFTSSMKRRVVRSHNLNVSSSRSHCIFTLHCRQERYQRQPSSEGGVGSCGGIVDVVEHDIRLVDLAGSEKLKSITSCASSLSDISTARLVQESIDINRSLLALGKVITALSSGKGAASSSSSHVPYRDSKLTTLLRPALGGNALAVMIACVHPEYIDESVNTMTYAGRARKIQNSVLKYEDPKTIMIRNLKAQVAELKAELAAARGQAEDVAAMDSSMKQPVSADVAAAQTDPSDLVSSLSAKLVVSCQRFVEIMKVNEQLRAAFDKLEEKAAGYEIEMEQLHRENLQLRDQLTAIEAAHDRPSHSAVYAAPRPQQPLTSPRSSHVKIFTRKMENDKLRKQIEQLKLKTGASGAVAPRPPSTQRTSAPTTPVGNLYLPSQQQGAQPITAQQLLGSDRRVQPPAPIPGLPRHTVSR